MASRQLRVHGVDIKPEWIARIVSGDAPFHEPGLEDAMRAATAAGHLNATTDVGRATDATVYVLTVGTPLRADGTANLGYIGEATKAVARVLKDGDLVILRSTVKIGTARNTVAPILAATGKRFEIAVCPERTLEGRALHELGELPQVIGADSEATRARCARLFGQLTPATVPVSSLEAGELVKLVDNTYRDVTFAFANEVAHLCGHLGVSANEVISAGKLGYARTNVARPGPVGGPCLEKDPHILAQSAKACGARMLVTEAARRVNERLPHDAVELIAARLARAAGARDQAIGSEVAGVRRIVVLGLAFKGRPETDDLRGTMAKPLVAALCRAFPECSIVGYDPLASPELASAMLGIEIAGTLEGAVAGAGLVVLANNHALFKDVDLGAVASAMRAPGVVYDLWSQRNTAALRLPAGVNYVALGDEALDIGVGGNRLDTGNGRDDRRDEWMVAAE